MRRFVMLFSLRTITFLMLFLIIHFRNSNGELFNENGKREIVTYHNFIRSQVAHGNFVTKRKTTRPSGANIWKMKWNETLARSSDSFVRKNPSTHSFINAIGENIYWHWSTKPGDLNKYGQKAAESWIKEFQDMNWDTTILSDELFKSGVGHATQMVWANTHQIGCAYSTIKETHKKSSRPIHKITVVCHYWPKGNFLNEPIYMEGLPCSKCKKCEKPIDLCEF